MTVLADAILVVHLLFVLFVLLGLALVPVGALTGCWWVRSFRWRAAHLGAVLFVAAEALVGAACPLTVWEDALRGRSGRGSFLARQLHAVLFYDLPGWWFTAAYLVAAGLAMVLWAAVRPTRPE